jgi:protein TonB
MHSAVPWLSSLILHALFLGGVVILSTTPPDVPVRLVLDFQLIAPELAQTVEPEPIAKAVSPPPVVKEPVPAPKIQQAKPEKISEPVEPMVEPTVEPELSKPEPVVAPITADVPVMQNTVVSDIDREVEREQRYARTVKHVRGLVLKKLQYPAIARRLGLKGRLVLSFTLCADGSVEDLKVADSSGHKILDRAALKAVATNTPFAGEYARTEVQLPINFQLN